MPEDDALQTTLREEALDLGASYFGVADLALARESVRQQGGEIAARFPLAVSVGVAMPFAIVDLLPLQEDRAVALAYRSHGYEILNHRLDGIASRLATTLQREGFCAFPVRASQVVDEERLYGLFSHKLAAHLAGLGWIGKSCLLVTPETGPRVRWASVLTDAPLTAGQPMAERCAGCEACVEACPAHAFTGRNFSADEPREARFDAKECHAYARRREEEIGVRVCGLCVYICPHGQKGERNAA